MVKSKKYLLVALNVITILTFFSLTNIAIADDLSTLKELNSYAGKLQAISKNIRITMADKYPLGDKHGTNNLKQEALNSVALTAFWINFHQAQICINEIIFMHIAYSKSPDSAQGKQLKELITWEIKVLRNIRETIFIYQNALENMEKLEKQQCSEGIKLIGSAEEMILNLCKLR